MIFGEVFARGYINGLIEEAKARGMKVIYSTVGRRDDQNNLRPLNSEELSQKDQPLINVPLEAGFDMELGSNGKRPVDYTAHLKLSEWKDAQLDHGFLDECRKKSILRFREQTQNFLKELEKQIPQNSRVLIAHTMAGGVPRTKIVMPVMNRVFKGSGDRYASSEEFWQSPLGRFCDMNFMEVTANTFSHLIELSKGLRERQSVSYVAFGYHGTEILIKNEYRWQSYSPYLQGFAKIELENVARRAFESGINACVFNAPEILTNSSSIFLGVEVALYPLLAAFKKESLEHTYTKDLLARCAALLKENYSLDDIVNLTNTYFGSETIGNSWSQYSMWPQHNGPTQMEMMRQTSQKILDMHKSEKHLLTSELSEVVFRSTGKAMINEGFKPQKPVWWIGHDLVARLATR